MRIWVDDTDRRQNDSPDRVAVVYTGRTANKIKGYYNRLISRRVTQEFAKAFAVCGKSGADFVGTLGMLASLHVRRHR